MPQTSTVGPGNEFMALALKWDSHPAGVSLEREIINTIRFY